MWDRERIEKEFHTNFEKGLTSEAAKDKLVKEGLNELTDKTQVSNIALFLKGRTGKGMPEEIQAHQLGWKRAVHPA